MKQLHGAMCCTLLALLTTSSGVARPVPWTVRHLASASPKSIGVLRGGGEAGQSSADKEHHEEGQAASASYEFGIEAMTQNDFESAVSHFTAGINGVPQSARLSDRLFSARAEAYAELKQMDKSFLDTMEVLVRKEQAFASMAAPSQKPRGEPCSAASRRVWSDDDIVHSEEDAKQRSSGGLPAQELMRLARKKGEAEKLLGSLQLLAELMTRHPPLAQDEACLTLSHYLSELAKSTVRQKDYEAGQHAQLEELGRDLQDARKTMLSRLTSLLADQEAKLAEQEAQLCIAAIAHRALEDKVAAREAQVASLSQRLSEAEDAAAARTERERARVTEIERERGTEIEIERDTEAATPGGRGRGSATRARRAGARGGGPRQRRRGRGQGRSGND